jgi:two-component system NarL family sensor kinase
MMKTARRQRRKKTQKRVSVGKPQYQRIRSSALQLLTTRLADAEATLHAIQRGEVDAVVIAGKQGPQVFTLKGAEYTYRTLIEHMNQGALILTADKMILYANQCFARMVKCPLQQLIGTSLRRFLSPEGRASLRPVLHQAHQSGAKIEVFLKAGNGLRMPVHISSCPLAKNGADRATFGLIVTDMTEARDNEERLRTLTHRVVQAQEGERGRVALELHDHITQLLCAIIVRCQTPADKPAAGGRFPKRKAIELCKMLGQTVEEVERISRNLRPSALDQLGLVAVLRDTSTEFAARMGVSLQLACVQLTARLPADTELTLYRVLQEGLKNVEKHAHARHIRVRLTQRGAFVQLIIHDDGIGFDPRARREGMAGLGLFSMRERATYAGGALDIRSARGEGTTIRAQLPLLDACRKDGKLG